jgi:hypothetical protein
VSGVSSGDSVFKMRCGSRMSVRYTGNELLDCGISVPCTSNGGKEHGGYISDIRVIGILLYYFPYPIESASISSMTEQTEREADR